MYCITVGFQNANNFLGKVPFALWPSLLIEMYPVVWDHQVDAYYYYLMVKGIEMQWSGPTNTHYTD